MGTDDLEITLGMETPLEDLTSYTLTGSTYVSYTAANGIFNNNGAEGYWKKGVLRDPDYTNGFKVRGLFLLSQSVNSDVFGYIKMNDGNLFYFGLRRSSTNVPQVAYVKSTTYNDEDGQFMTGTGQTSAATTHVIVELHFKSNGNVDIYYDNFVASGSLQTKTFAQFKAEATSLITADVMTWTNSATTRVIEYGFGRSTLSGTPTYSVAAFYADLDTGTQYSGDASIPADTIKRIISHSGLGGGGAAQLIFSALTSSELSTLLDNHRKTLVIYRSDGVIAFKGEVKEILSSRNIVEWRCEEGSRKLVDTFSRYNPVLRWSEVKNVEDNVLNDVDTVFTTNEFQNKLFVSKDASIYELTAHVTSIDGQFLFSTTATSVPDSSLVPTTPDILFGDKLQIYWDDLTKTTYSRAIGDYTPAGAGASLWETYTMDIYHKTGTEWDNVSLRWKGRFTSLKGADVFGTDDNRRASIYIYNRLTDTWERVLLFSKDEYSTDDVSATESWNSTSMETNMGDSLSPIFDVTLDLISILGVSAFTFKSQYMAADGAANDSGFSLSNVRIAVRANQNSSVSSKGFEIHLMELKLSVDTTPTQGQVLSTGLIASNTAIQITIDNTPAWALAKYPQADGVSKGDDYYITDDIETIMDGIFAGMADWTLSRNFNNSLAQFGDIEDLFYQSVFDVLQKYSEEHNLAYWYRPTDTTNVIEIRDNFESTGVTFTKADIYGYYDRNFSIRRDNKNLRENIIAEGDEGIQVTKTATGGSPDYSVAAANTLGPEDVLYRNNEIYNERNVGELATSKIQLHSQIAVQAEITIDISTPNQSYDTIEIGKTVNLEIDEYSSASEGALLIEYISYRKIELEARHEFMILSLIKRNQA